MEMFQIAIQGGSFGVLAWIVWFLFARGLPQILSTFASTLQTQQASFMETLKEERDRFFTGLKTMQELNITSYREHRNALQAQQNAIVEALKDNTEMLQQIQVEIAKQRTRG